MRHRSAGQPGAGTPGDDWNVEPAAYEQYSSNLSLGPGKGDGDRQTSKGSESVALVWAQLLFALQYTVRGEDLSESFNDCALGGRRQSAVRITPRRLVGA